ncbi:aspartate carbamoyltransferase regulatory subunit [Natronospirillum operosum]|uniref:Aspartate carbamoyltransferase regulatory chain n=1 Tax=Natronospirillum operosum TaxID=2759953 RepID=A0A4Z0WA61_9GAMM|nr:aspartate carbamoyltransferase regulatory subunit [Natronospirillum operosum]TGG95519.1 aspartate carbamoyltransferase regulatory subunit [Natronospirillum operosum]
MTDPGTQRSQLQVEAIRRGTVIDHVPAGNGIKIVHRVQKLSPTARLTVGLNLPSGAMGSKDLIKVDDWLFTEQQAYELALFAPEATINVIDDYKVVNKFKMSLPDTVVGVFDCPNSNCISHNEPVQSHFHVLQEGGHVALRCHYCERKFRDTLFN